MRGNPRLLEVVNAAAPALGAHLGAQLKCSCGTGAAQLGRRWGAAARSCRTVAPQLCALALNKCLDWATEKMSGRLKNLPTFCQSLQNVQHLFQWRIHSVTFQKQKRNNFVFLHIHF